MIQTNLQSEAARSGGILLAHPMRKFAKPIVQTDLSTTRIALYLLRFNVALQIAAIAILINLVLAVATFWYGLNSLYCAFGMDCVIGTITSCILVWRFASSRHDHLKQRQHIYLLSSYSDTIYSRANLMAATKYDHLLESCREDPPNTEHTEDHIRELWSTFWLGQVMIISGVGIVIRTVVEVVSHALIITEDFTLDRTDYGFEGQNLTPLPVVTSMEPLYTLALISLALNLILMVAKLVVYVFLKSNSMLIEGVNSFISALFAAVAVVSICYADYVHYLDQIVSILFGIFLIIYGGYNMLITVGETVYTAVKKRPAGYELLV